ncbi:MAG TPA: hypothetical protein PK156_16995, partial [Polyangium sp.]|nr:hypothetical protein [Polyangium sp.]
TGICSNPTKADGASCNDNDACTKTDGCQSGTCIGTNPVNCTAAETCHDGGTCDPATGICSGPISADGTSCNDNDACTQSDTCLSGTCTGANPITCGASDECEIAGSCNSATGACDNTAKADGTYCSHGICQNGKCTEQCNVDADCGELFECTRFHQCQPLTEGPLDSGAICSCKTVGAPGMLGQTSAIPLVALFALGLRRRRARL